MGGIFHQKQSVIIRQACVETIERRLLLSAGAIDTTFGNGGTVTLPAETSEDNGWVNNPKIAVQASGRIITSESIAENSSRIVGLKPDGSLDPNFGSDGLVYVPDGSITALLIESDGSILLVGKDLTHLSANGVLDKSYGEVALPTLSAGAALQADNRVVVDFSAYANDGNYVQRYNTDGSLDTTYGIDGTATLVSSFPGAVAIDNQGRAVIGLGMGVGPGPQQDIGVTRLTTTGQIDTSFGNDGVAADFGSDDDAAAPAILVAPDGTIYVTGTFDQFNGDEESPVLAYSNTGQLIGANSAGVSFGGLLGLAVQTNGKLVAVGYGDVPSVVVVDRFLPPSDGLSRDMLFNGSGQQTFAINSEDFGELTALGNIGWSVALQTDGNILVAGTTSNNGNSDEYTITRLIGDPNTTIGGTVYSDVNDDGKRESGEPGVAGQIVYDDLDNSGAFQPDDPTTTTDSSGNYVLYGVPYGAAIIREMVQPGQQQTYPTNGYGEHVTVGQTPVTGANFGVHESPKLAGTVIGTPGSYRNHGTTIADVFDGNLSTYFDARDPSGDWAGLDLGSAQVITQLSYAPRAGWESRMVGGMFQGSNSADFSIGNVTLYTVTSVPAAGVLTTVRINNPSAFRYVRYIGPTNSYCDIAEAEFFGGTPLVGATLYPDGTLVVNGTAGADNIHVALDATSLGSATVTINSATQVFAAGVLNVVVNAGAGNDTVLVDGDDTSAAVGTTTGLIGVTVNGGDGNDSLSAYLSGLDSSSDNSLYLDGGGGDDYLFVRNYGNATLIGGDGNDTFNSNGTNEGLYESVYGGDGNDTLIADGDTQYSIFDGGAGSNTIDYTHSGDQGYVTVDMANGFLVNVNNLIGSQFVIEVIANDNGDTITYADAGLSNVTVQGGAGNDIISINGGYDVEVDGNGGNDNITVTNSESATVNGGAGNDTINVRGNFTPSSVDGGPGFDIAYTDPGDTVVNVESLNPDNLAPFSGTVIGTAGSYRNHGTTIANVFDDNLSTYFDAPDASGDWVGLDLGSAKVVTQVKYAPRVGWEYRMVGGEIQASNSANFSSGVVTLYTITSTPTAGVLTTASFSNTTAFRYYRYIGPVNSYCDIAELEFDS